MYPIDKNISLQYLPGIIIIPGLLLTHALCQGEFTERCPVMTLPSQLSRESFKLKAFLGRGTIGRPEQTRYTE